MKTIYYRTRWDGAGKWKVQFWTKDNNVITKTLVTVSEEKIRAMIERELGRKHFDLVQMKWDENRER